MQLQNCRQTISSICCHPANTNKESDSNLYQTTLVFVTIYYLGCRYVYVQVMPSRHRLCWCLGGSKPEISYNAADNGGLQPVPMDVAEPMPTDAAELDAKFTELVVS